MRKAASLRRKAGGALVEKRSEVPKVQVYYGATGTGKSHAARDVFDAYYLWTPARGKRWDHSEGHKHMSRGHREESAPKLAEMQ